MNDRIFSHIVNRHSGNRGANHGFHFDAGLKVRRTRTTNDDLVLFGFMIEIDFDVGKRNRVTKRNQIGRSLKRNRFFIDEN